MIVVIYSQVFRQSEASKLAENYPRYSFEPLPIHSGVRMAPAPMRTVLP